MTFIENLNKYLVTPLVAIFMAVAGAYFYVIQEQVKETTARVESELKEREFDNALKFRMYGEVKEALLAKNPKLQSAVLMIVNEMLDSQRVFRDKLVRLMLNSPNIDTSVLIEQKQIDVINRSFDAQNSTGSNASFRIDVFWLEDLEKEALPRAVRIVDLLKAQYPTYDIRLRKLPRAVNSRPGYNISSNEIRFEHEELPLAVEVEKIITSRGVFNLEQPVMREITFHTGNYISVFVRNM